MNKDRRIPKDTDNIFELTLKDEETENPIDLDNLSGIVVIVFQEPDLIIDQYSKNTQAGFRDLVITDAVNGIMRVHVNAEQMIKACEDEPLYYEIKTQAVNANFDNATEEKSTGAKRIGTVVGTDAKNVTFA